MPKKSRSEVRRAALRAAAQVALLSGMFACNATTTELIDSGPVPADAGVLQNGEADAAVSDEGVLDTGLADLGAFDATVADAGPVCGTIPTTEAEFAAWEACCRMNPTDPGCFVWGPPAPPEFA